MSINNGESSSPKWSTNIKLVISLIFVALIAAFLVNFRNILGPLLMAFIITYMLHPITGLFSKITHLSWRASANILFLIFIIIIITIFTVTGVAIAQQIQSLIRVLQRFLTDLPAIVDNLSKQVYTIGPFRLELGQFLDLNSLSSELINAIQLLLGRAGSLVSTFVTGAATTLGWTLFTLLVSYFILTDVGEFPDLIDYIKIPGYDADIRRMGRELGNIWNAFLRGQLIIVTLVIIMYTLLMSILGVNYALGIAILAGIARFVPYVGPLTTGIITALVAFLQGHNYYGLDPVYYMVLVVTSAVILDQIFDNLVSPRILGQSLGIHPAALLVTAIIAANLIGIIGLVLAAPVLASAQLISGYTLRKMFDLDPWPEQEQQAPSVFFLPITKSYQRLLAWWQKRKRKP